MDFRALIVDDEETYARSLQKLLERRGVRADHAASREAALDAARRQRYHLVLLDYLLPDGSGLDLIAPLCALRPAPEILMMTAFGTIENAVEAMRRGASDYVTKSTAIDDLVERVLDARRVAEARSGRHDEASAAAFEGLLGESPRIREARARIAEVARAEGTTVLLTGESGTGKGVVARAIHALGPRSAEPFVTVDCVALPPSLAESELFGHEKGAFTSADRAKPGKLEACGRGTVFLDEIGDMDPALQGKLLRVLEERTFERVGGLKPLVLHARVIAATHRDLGALVDENRFRLDLYHRLMVFPIALPPLRERGHDVLLLAERFLAVFAARLGKRFQPLRPDVSHALLAYDYPGNVRELKNILERAAILATSAELAPSLLPPRLFAHSPAARPEPSDSLRPIRPIGIEGQTEPVAAEGVEGGAAADLDGPFHVAFRPGEDRLDDLERKLLEEALRRAGGKKARAAELLGISRYALMRRVEKYRL